MSEDKTTERCADCGAPATRRSADGVPLCEGDYEHLVEHWQREFGASSDADTTLRPCPVCGGVGFHQWNCSLNQGAPAAVMASMELETDPLPDAVAAAWDVSVGDENYIEDRLGNTLAVVVGYEHVWIDVLMANDDASVLANWRQVATLPPAQIRGLITLLSNGLSALENQNG